MNRSDRSGSTTAARSRVRTEVDPEAAPALADVIASRTERAMRLADYLAALTTDELARTVDVRGHGPHQIGDCLSTVFEEEFWHHRYADRDLAELARRFDRSPE